MTVDHDSLMLLAVQEARLGREAGEQPFGAVVARDGEVICRTRSLKVSTSDTTAHSEILAIKCATQKLQQRIIADCTFYATCEPCPMCLGAILNAGINTLVLGARNRHLQDEAILAFHFKDFTAERFAEMTGWDLEVIDGVLTDECVQLYRDANIELTR